MFASSVTHRQSRALLSSSEGHRESLTLRACVRMLLNYVTEVPSRILCYRPISAPHTRAPGPADSGGGTRFWLSSSGPRGCSLDAARWPAVFVPSAAHNTSLGLITALRSDSAAASVASL